ncbi:MAG: ABC transporter ATP-binding protein [Alphaproteobacteria bacterium]
MISVDGLNFGYGEKPILENISFTLEKGRTIALVGNNGAGKTTLLRCLAGLEKPWAGHISIAGINLLHHPAMARQKLGYVRDLFGLYDEMSGREFLQFIARTRKISTAQYHQNEANIDTQLHLSPIIDKKIAVMTRGMRQKIAIAQALIHNPDILLLDEPASGLDPDARLELSALLNKLREQGKTTIVSSHILGELQQYTNAILVLKDGKISLLSDASTNASNTLPHYIITMELLHNGAAYQQRLQQQWQLESALIAPDKISLRLAAAPTDIANLLQQLLHDSWPIFSFHTQRPGLAEQYHEANNIPEPAFQQLSPRQK